MRRPVSAARPTRLLVNPVACEAVGLCAHLAPDVVDLDRWGYPIVDQAPLSRDEEPQARRAARGCPRRALVVAPQDSVH
jgi:ferredoxin